MKEKIILNERKSKIALILVLSILMLIFTGTSKVYAYVYSTDMVALLDIENGDIIKSGCRIEKGGTGLQILDEDGTTVISSYGPNDFQPGFSLEYDTIVTQQASGMGSTVIIKKVNVDWSYKIRFVSAKVTSPVEGERPSYTSKSGDSNAYSTEVVAWYELQDNDDFESRIELSPTDTFKANKMYLVKIHFIANQGYEFAFPNPKITAPDAMINQYGGPQSIYVFDQKGEELGGKLYARPAEPNNTEPGDNTTTDPENNNTGTGDNTVTDPENNNTGTGDNTTTSGGIEVKEVEGNFGNATVSLNNQNIEDLIELSTDEQNAITTGKPIYVFVEADDISESVSTGDKELVKTKLEDGLVVGKYLDINLFKQVEGENKVKVEETNGKVKISFEIPESLRSSNREFYIIRVHGTEVTKITPTVNGNTLTFETDRFSTYALAYTDTNATAEDTTKTTTETETTTSNNPKTGDNIVTIFSIFAIATLGTFTTLKLNRNRKARKH